MPPARILHSGAGKGIAGNLDYVVRREKSSGFPNPGIAHGAIIIESLRDSNVTYITDNEELRTGGRGRPPPRAFMVKRKSIIKITAS